MSRIIIPANPTEKRIPKKQGSILEVAEMFTDTIQGENFTGVPATFLRLQHCTLDCQWCDTTEVWKYGNPYHVEEIIEIINKYGIFSNLINGDVLVISGGSPLKQQKGILDLIQLFRHRFHFVPFIEIENECVIKPLPDLVQAVTTWNNSPKLSNSNNPAVKRYKPDVIKYMSSLNNSWFKFVITNEEDWQEIYSDFIKPSLIKRSQIVLMPEGQTKQELDLNREIAVKMAIKHHVRFTDRLHITLWDKKTGV